MATAVATEQKIMQGSKALRLCSVFAVHAAKNGLEALGRSDKNGLESLGACRQMLMESLENSTKNHTKQAAQMSGLFAFIQFLLYLSLTFFKKGSRGAGDRVPA